MRPLRTLVMSDLHLEFRWMEPDALNCDLALLPGDIGRPLEAVAFAVELGIPSIVVPGNHEFYHQDLREAVERMKTEAAGTLVQVLDAETAHLDIAGRQIRVIGATLWTDYRLHGDDKRELCMEQAARFLNDHRVITHEGRLFRPEDAATLNERHTEFIEAESRRPFAGTTLIATHHAPSDRSTPAQYREPGRLTNAAFCSNHDELVARSGAALWVHGHTHGDADYRIGDTRVVSSQRGYPGEKAFAPAVIEI